MFGYRWDTETGGVILEDVCSEFSKEARPVYAHELETLGVDWDYEHQNEVPYMWAENNSYWYRGRLVAKTHGGCLYKTPAVEVIELPEMDQPLKPIDIDRMVEKNNRLLEALIKDTAKNISKYYTSYRDKVDVFYVAFSGGKDSLVILDLIQRTLPHNAFKVLFGDTGMEFSDTYKLIDQVEQWCQEHHIEFVRSKSKLDPVKSWELFGPPAHTIRWCCSVHKTTPQVLKLREMTANPQFRGFAFTGVRAEESESRSEYEEVNLGEKIRGQYSCHPILKWNSVEVFLYMWKEKLIFNEAYKKGNNRVGCLVCPMVSMKNMHFRYREYREACQSSPGVDIFNQLILKTSSKTFSDQESEDEFMNLGGWKARKSGKELSIATDIYRDEVKSEHLHIHLKKLSDDWREWIKTIGEVISLREDGFCIFRPILATLFRSNLAT